MGRWESSPKTRISKAEAAERLGCSEKTIDRLRAAGELVAVRSWNTKQGRVQITVDSLEAYEQRQVDIEKRFPIPELDQARAATQLGECAALLDLAEAPASQRSSTPAR